MRNVIKYDSANLQPDSIKSGNFNISTKLIPSIPSGFYNGITPIIGGYTIYVNKTSGGPSIYSPKNDSELVGISQSLGGIPTTNLIANAGLTTYNNVPSDVSSVLVQTSEKYKGATVWKQTLTPLTANGVSWLSNGNNPGIGVLISNAGGGLANRFTGYSIFFKPTVPMYTNPIFTSYSNIVGYQSTRNYDDMGDGWFRAHVIWFDTVTRSDAKFWAINPLSSTLNTPIDIYWAGPFKEDRNDSLKVASFVNGTRGTTATDSLTWLNYQSNMTVANENYPDIVTSGLVLNLDAGFVSSYPKTGTDWKDLSGNGNDGTLVNGVGFSGGSMVFDGVDDECNVIGSLGVYANYTIGFWALRNAENRMPISGRLNTNFYWFGDNSWRYVHGGVADEYYYPKNVGIPLGQWGYYCVVYDGSNVKIYRQGIFQGQKATSGTADWSQGIKIGDWSAGGSYSWLGNISNVKFYNRALSDQEILQNYYAGLQRFIPTDGLVLSLDAQNTNLYATSPTTAYDISGNGNNGTLTNGVQYISDGGGSWSFDGVDDYINVPNSSSLQVTGDQTLVFWVKPERGVGRQNFYNKAYGGEGTITYESTGDLNYYWGTSGVNDFPYQGVSTVGMPMKTLNIWYFLVVVRELSTTTKTVKWYVNGVLNNTVSASYSAAVAGGSPITIGTGYAGTFLGKVGIVYQYNKALTQEQITTIYNATKSRYGI